MANLQIYPCSMTGPCFTYGCYQRTAYMVARKDLDLGTAMATGIRICTQCAQNLADNLPLALMGTVGDVVAKMQAAEPETITAAEFAQEAAKAGDAFDPILPTANVVEATATMSMTAPDEGQLAVTPDLEATVVEPEADETEAADAEEHFRCLDCNRDFTNKGSYIRHMNSAAHKK